MYNHFVLCSDVHTIKQLLPGKVSFGLFLLFNPRTYKQTHIPPLWYKGVVEGSPLGFCCVTRFQKISPLQDKVKVMGCGAADL